MFVPAQITIEEGVAETVGKEFTVTVMILVFTHPLASVPVIVYVVLVFGFAITVAPVVALSPVEGAQA